MCRLLTLIEPEKELQEKAIRQFAELADCGLVPPGTSRGHADGWGVVAYKNGEIRVTEKQPTTAYQNPAFIDAGLREQSPSLLISHLRKASRGKVSIENTQPYTLNSFSFGHNGTVSDFEKLTLTPKFQATRKGESDSEVIFLWLIQKIIARPNSIEIFTEACRELKDCDYTATNIIFTNGKFLFAMRQANEKNKNVAKDNLCDDYYTLFLGKLSGKTKVICSQRLDIDGLTWTAIPNHAIVAINLETHEEKIVNI